MAENAYFQLNLAQILQCFGLQHLHGTRCQDKADHLLDHEADRKMDLLGQASVLCIRDALCTSCKLKNRSHTVNKTYNLTAAGDTACSAGKRVA